MQKLAASELILNSNGSIYHLNLLPENIANTIITVGDPERVPLVASYFDSVEFKMQKREFHTQTGTFKGERITVISTGIGTDNIDIVLNELDALANINLKTRRVKKDLTSLKIIRIGTTGAIQPEIPIDSFLLSKMAIGFDSLLHNYESEEIQQKELSEALQNHLELTPEMGMPYCVSCDEHLAQKFNSEEILKGITATNIGFYGPQGRVLRLPLRDRDLQKKITEFNYENKKIMNLEMETSGIYGLSKLLGHQAVSLNAVLANRATGEFSKNPKKTMKNLIEFTINRIALG